MLLLLIYSTMDGEHIDGNWHDIRQRKTLCAPHSPKRNDTEECCALSSSQEAIHCLLVAICYLCFFLPFLIHTHETLSLTRIHINTQKTWWMETEKKMRNDQINQFNSINRSETILFYVLSNAFHLFAFSVHRFATLIAVWLKRPKNK